MRAYLLALALAVAANADVKTPLPDAAVPTQGPACTCDYDKVWNDVVYLFESAEGTTDKTLLEMLGAVQTTSAWFNIQKSGYAASNYSMRMGIITYASNATVLYPLGSLDNDDVEEIERLPYNDKDPVTNVEAAIEAAIDQFRLPARRPSSKMVIVVMATMYNASSSMSAQGIANQFKEDGGIIVVYDYAERHAPPSLPLEQIASPGYFLFAANSTLEDLKKVQCDANCFCPIMSSSFVSDARQNPTSGCYYNTRTEIPGNYKVAQKECQKYHFGWPTSDESLTQSEFLQSLYLSPTPSFYIGLTFDTSSRQWLWEDGKPLSQSYQPWSSGVPPTDGSNGACVFVDYTSLNWTQTDCRNSYLFTCEVHPCDSTNYCD